MAEVVPGRQNGGEEALCSSFLALTGLQHLCRRTCDSAVRYAAARSLTDGQAGSLQETWGRRSDPLLSPDVYELPRTSDQRWFGRERRRSKEELIGELGKGGVRGNRGRCRLMAPGGRPGTASLGRRSMRHDAETLTAPTSAIHCVVFIIESPADGAEGVLTVGAVIGSLPSPGQGARRSRRGYYYQDLVSLGFCIDMLSGQWDHVTPDGDEDIVCVAADPAKVTYVQVKTEESAGQHWTVSKCTRPEIVGRPETSVLGRLFVGKPLPDESAFILLTNEGVSDDLRPLTVLNRGSTADVLLRTLEQRLTPLELEGGRTIRWCLERLIVEQCETSADSLEDRVLLRLQLLCQQKVSSLFADESGRLLKHLMDVVGSAARSRDETHIERAAFEQTFTVRVEEILGLTAASQGPHALTLRDKLTAAGFVEDEIYKMEQWRIAFSREHRQALRARRRALDDVLDRVAVVCFRVTAMRESGTVAPGAASYLAIEQEIGKLHETLSWPEAGVDMPLALGALHEITARCQNRYVS